MKNVYMPRPKKWLCIALGLVVVAWLGTAPRIALAQGTGEGPCSSDWKSRAVQPPSEIPNHFAVHQNADYRIEVEQCQDGSVQKNADAVVAIFRESDFESDGYDAMLVAGYRLEDQIFSLADASGETVVRPICSSEKFQEQRRPAGCSGVLVAPTLVLTAGHCVSGSEPHELLMLLDFKVEGGKEPDLLVSEADPRQLNAKAILQYSGSDIEPPDSWRENISEDVALVELVEPVDNARVASLSPDSGSVATGDRVYALGFPSGLPMKLAPDGKIYESLYYGERESGPETGEKFFFTDLSTMAGNSGSPVFSSGNHEVEGILVSGQEDFLLYERGNCATSFCDVAVGGCARREAVARVSSMPAAILDEIAAARGGAASGEPLLEGESQQDP